MSTQPTIEQLLEENRRLRQENKRLSHYQPFGILTRTGFFEMYKKGEHRNGWLVYADLDRLKQWNDRIGKPAVNRLIKKSFQIRDTDLILKGQTSSGDEYGCILRSGSDPSAFAIRLKANFKINGLGITVVIVRIQRGSLQQAIDKADAKLHQIKKTGRRGAIIVID